MQGKSDNVSLQEEFSYKKTRAFERCKFRRSSRRDLCAYDELVNLRLRIVVVSLVFVSLLGTPLGLGLKTGSEAASHSCLQNR